MQLPRRRRHGGSLFAGERKTVEMTRNELTKGASRRSRRQPDVDTSKLPQAIKPDEPAREEDEKKAKPVGEGRRARVNPP